MNADYDNYHAETVDSLKQLLVVCKEINEQPESIAHEAGPSTDHTVARLRKEIEIKDQLIDKAQTELA